ncbi:helix-turn-helix domain-containing protein [Streptomyces bacillaris]|uniref:helix-turn-helix domain-containing protein n=1 Tax=Streptomyces bacillaris TaxID=68179 RepID=UPI0036F508CB
MVQGVQEGGGGSAARGGGEPGSVEAARALGQQLRRLRESVQLTQELMVKLHGGSKTSISRYENGDRIPRATYVRDLLEETRLRGVPLTEDALAAMWAMYERALGPVGGRNSERAALYAQEKQLWLVRDQEAQAAEELARLAAERDGLETDLGSGEDLARRQELDADVARIHEERALLARRRQRILTTMDRMSHPGDDPTERVLPPYGNRAPDSGIQVGHLAFPPGNAS